MNAKKISAPRWSSLVLGSLLVVIASAQALAQETNLSSFYGSQNLQYVSFRYAPWISPWFGNAGEILLGFNTSSKKTEEEKHWISFYGVALGMGGFMAPEAELGSYDRREVSAGYGLIQLENKIFVTLEGSLWPYFGLYAGAGTGSIWMKDDPDLPDPPLPALNLYYLGVEAGLQLPLRGDYALSLALGVNANFIQFGVEARVYFPVMITIGLSKWLGPLKD